MTTDLDLAPADSTAGPNYSGKPSPAPWNVAPETIERLLQRVVISPGAVMNDSITPMTGGIIAQLPDSTKEDVDRAFISARAAQVEWAKKTPRERGAWLLNLHDLIFAHQDELLDLIQIESGKSRKHGFDEIMDVALNCRHYARKAEKYIGERKVPGAIPTFTQTRVRYVPKGVVGVVAPWNYPLSMSITDVIPALVAGNAVVLRPDDKSTLTALRAVELMDQAGLPADLLQVVLGPGRTVGSHLLGQSDYVMFTGSTKSGRVVAAQAAERLKGASLELGGKNPIIVRADVNVKSAVKRILTACFSSAGQLCISIERIYVHDAVADRFIAAFAEAVNHMKLSPELAYGVDMGSLISQAQLDTVRSHIDDAVSKGARVLAGGNHRPDIGPFFHEPTVLTDVTEDMIVCREETFGPLVSIYRVSSDEEAIARANDSEYGLNSAVFTSNTRTGRLVANQLQTGTVNVNEGYAAAWGSMAAPMGGFKDSGMGRRHGAEGIQKYTESQNVSVQKFMSLGSPFGLGEAATAKFMTTSLKIMKKLGLS